MKRIKDFGSGAGEPHGAVKMHQAKRICLLVLSIYLSEVTAQNLGNFYNPEFIGGIGCGSHDLGHDADPIAKYMAHVNPATLNGLLVSLRIPNCPTPDIFRVHALMLHQWETNHDIISDRDRRRQRTKSM